MKRKLWALVAVLAMVTSISTAAFSQTEITDDVVFIKLGYANETIKTDFPGADEDSQSGVAIQGEYNINLKPLFVGIGMDYQYLTGDNDSKIQYLSPVVTAKFMTAGGLYLGAGLSGRYLIGYEDENDGDPDKKIDLWTHGVIGFIMPIDEGVYFNIEGKIGYNLTKQQFDDSDAYDIDYDYDMAIYVGIGFRAFSTGL